MSVVSCNEIKNGRTGELNADQSRRWVRTFRVVTDDDTDGPATVLFAAGLPSLGDTYDTGTESDPLASLKSMVPTQDEADARLWLVECTYDTKADATAQSGGGSGTPGGGGASPQNRPENPLDRPAEWRAGSVKVKKAVMSDKDNADVKNSAGLFYNPGYEVDRALGQITVTKNYSSKPFKDALDLIEKVNDAVWYGFAAKTVKIDGLDIQSAYENGVSYVRVTWTLLYDPDGWSPTRILDRGPYYLVGGVVTYDVDANGVVTPDVLLDGAGGKSAVPTYNLFRFHDTTSFANIP